MIKTLSKLVTGATYLNIIKSTHDKPVANVRLKDEKLKAFLLISETRQGCPRSPLLCNIILEVLGGAISKK